MFDQAVREFRVGTGETVIIDAEDWQRVNSLRWKRHKQGRDFTKGIYIASGKHPNLILLHRFVMNAPEGMEVDHINHNRLDNRKSNLRVCSRSENQQNRGATKKNASGYKGVHYDRPTGRYMAIIWAAGKRYHLGRFDTPIEAAGAYDEAAKKHHGVFARLNLSTGSSPGV